jgi:UDP-glucose 6-dehydrogenase
MWPDRMIVGADDERVVLKMRALFAPFTATTERDAIAGEVARRGIDVEFAVFSTPQFLKEGAAVVCHCRGQCGSAPSINCSRSSTFTKRTTLL